MIAAVRNGWIEVFDIASRGVCDLNVTVPLAFVLVLAAAFGASVVLNVVQRIFIRGVLIRCAGEGLRTEGPADAGGLAAHLCETQGNEEGEHVGESRFERSVLSPAQRAESIAKAYHLTPREGEVLALLLEGHGTARVAEKMVLSAATVKSHTYNIYGKMGVHSHQEMIDACEAVEAASARSARMGDVSESRMRYGHTPSGLSRSMA